MFWYPNLVNTHIFVFGNSVTDVTLYYECEAGMRYCERVVRENVLILSDFLLLCGSAAVIVWDSPLQDGYKLKQSCPKAEGVSRKRSTPVCWDGKRTCDVVVELLRNSTDKAYGTEGE